MVKRRKLSDPEARFIAFLVVARDIEHHQGGEQVECAVAACGGTDLDTDAVRRMVGRLADQLRDRAANLKVSDHIQKAVEDAPYHG